MKNTETTTDPSILCRTRRRMRRPVIALTLVATGLSMPASIAASAATKSRRVDITAANITYAPTAIAAKAGQKITFALKNMDSFKHNLTIKALKVNKDVLGGATGTATVTLKTKGTYEFHCEYHPQQMKGTITVS